MSQSQSEMEVSQSDTSSKYSSRPKSSNLGPVPSIFKSFFKGGANPKSSQQQETKPEELKKSVQDNELEEPTKVDRKPEAISSPKKAAVVASVSGSPSKPQTVEATKAESSQKNDEEPQHFAGAYMSAPPPEVAANSAHTPNNIFGSFADHLFASSSSSSSSKQSSKAKPKTNGKSVATTKSPKISSSSGTVQKDQKDHKERSCNLPTIEEQEVNAKAPSSGVLTSPAPAQIVEQPTSSTSSSSSNDQQADAGLQRQPSTLASDLLEDLKKMSTEVDEFNDFEEEEGSASESESESDEDDENVEERKDIVGDDEDEEDRPKKSKKLVQKTIVPRPAAAAEEVDDGNPLGTPGYDPIAHAGWKKGQKVPYAALAAVFAKCESTSKRLKIIAYVSDFFRSVIALSPEALLPSVYLCVNEVAPSYEGKELGIGDQILLKALSEATGSTLAAVKLQYRETGDLGVVAERCRAKQRTLVIPQRLTIQSVFSKLRDISDLKGSKSGDRKKDFIKQLLVSSVGHEARFLCRALQGNLRIQLGLLTVLRALARAIILTPPEYPPQESDTSSRFAEDDQIEDDEPEEDEEELAKKQILNARPRTKLEIMIDEAHAKIEAAYNEGPCLERLVNALLNVPLEKLHTKCFLVPGQPIKVMLGKPATGIDDIFEKFGNIPITLEYKYDGERAQIHRLPNGSFKIYSRNLEDHTPKYPDIIRKLPQALKAGTESFILDAEVVAWDPQSKAILPFQTLSTRKRKDVGENTVTVQVVLFGFDLLYLNGKSYMKRPFIERRAKMHEAFAETEGIFYYSKGLDTTDPDEIDAFFQKAVEDSCEGLMVKPLVKNSRYVPDKRKWIKIKKDYRDGVGDTLDLVPLGAWYGKGKRTGTYGAFLLFSYDENEQVFQAISKTGSGFKDTDLELFTESLKGHVIDGPKSYYQYSKERNLIPDVWFEPSQVWEIKCADLSISPVAMAAAGHVHESKGIAMRFPRFIRIRPDKAPENATTATQVAEMYLNQSVVKSSGAARGGPPRR